jgi:hypothetical protein
VSFYGVRCDDECRHEDLNDFGLILIEETSGNRQTMKNLQVQALPVHFTT